ncbi:hypothetical protein ACFLTS_04740 [Chloroflexota bacterium]
MSHRFARMAIIVLVVAAFFMLPQPVLAGTPDDTYTIERYYAQAADLQQTRSTTLGAAVTLTFIPPSTKDFVIIASALVNNESTSYYTQTTLDINTVDYSDSYNRPVDTANNWVSFGSHKVITCIGGQTQTIKIEYCSEIDTSYAYIKRASIIALEVLEDGDNNCVNIESNIESENSTTSYVPKVTLTFTPPEQQDYLLLATANLSNSGVKKATLVQLTQDTISTGGYEHEEDIYSSCGSAAVIENLSADQHVFAIEFASESTSYTALIKDARITAIPMADLADPGLYQYEGVEAASENITTTYADKTTMSLVTATRGDWLIIPMALGKNESTTASFYSRLNIDGTLCDEFAFKPVARTNNRN